jgi:predicted TPR repeat methyltransferase/cytochrome c-type biogenesis protein CcmH/NrfG
MSALKKAVAAAERLALSEKNMRAKMVAKSIAQDRAKQKSWWVRVLKAIAMSIVAILVFSYFGPDPTPEEDRAPLDMSTEDVRTVQILEDQAQVALLKGDMAKADTLYGRLLAIQPKHAESLYVRGVIRSSSKDKSVLEEAAGYFKRAIKIEPRRADFHSGLGEIYQVLDDIPAAIRSYQRAIKYSPAANANANNDLALLYMHTGKKDEARKLFEEALQADPKHAIIMNNLGKLEREDGRLEASLRWFKKAIETKRDYAVAHMNIGTLYAKMKDGPHAVAHLRKALELDPVNADIEQAKFVMKVLESDHVLEGDKDVDEKVENSMQQHAKRLFDGYANTFEVHLSQDLHYRMPSVFYQKLTERYDLNSNLRILDLGSGTGLIGKALVGFTRGADGGGALYGTDISSKMVKEAEKKNIYTNLYVEDCQLTLERFFRNNQVDIVTAADVFGYIGNLNPIFEKVRKALVFGGSFVFSTEACDDCDTYKIDTSTMRVRHATNHVLAIAEAHGFDVIDSELTWGRMESGEKQLFQVYTVSPNPMTLASPVDLL